MKKWRQADEKASNVTDLVSEPVTPTSITGPVPLLPDQQPSICLLERSVMGNTQYQRDRASQDTTVAIPNGADGSEESLHTIIIDCSALSFVDSVGAEVLQQVSMYVLTYMKLTRSYFCTSLWLGQYPVSAHRITHNQISHTNQ